MISEKYNCLFVHVPKTAGQSVESFFLGLHGLSWENRAPLLLKPNPDPARGPERLAHLTAQEYVGCGYVTEQRFRKFFKFAFVRNPWDRLVSVYHYKGFKDRYSFRDFILRGMSFENRYLGVYRHLMPQYEYLYDNKGNLLVDFIGRFENLQNDFEEVCKKLRIEPGMLPHRNPTKGRGVDTEGGGARGSKLNYTAYYDPELVKIVGDLYAKDVATFGYAFGK